MRLPAPHPYVEQWLRHTCAGTCSLKLRWLRLSGTSGAMARRKRDGPSLLCPRVTIWRLAIGFVPWNRLVELVQTQRCRLKAQRCRLKTQRCRLKTQRCRLKTFPKLYVGWFSRRAGGDQRPESEDQRLLAPPAGSRRRSRRRRFRSARNHLHRLSKATEDGLRTNSNIQETDVEFANASRSAHRVYTAERAAQVIPGGAGPPWRGGCSPTTSANGDYSEGALRNRPPVVGSKAATKGAGY
eukprot:1178941-Prorocentrum_minimum.AAC.2